ncbi:hypothetical protein AR438_01360 [Chryseobacterium aquaticum]|uniref:Cthe-2314-like HEPN domain-containing protein n=2 Tax=Chryseobacterium aquaticum TaxID=452084 RepID=A0A0Q3SNC1_9FLAO|nr:hypothetical protein AR438_01360 [Chryseobacterium aquaticum]
MFIMALNKYLEELSAQIIKATELKKNFESSDAFEFYFFLRDYTTSMFMFQQNFYELKKILKKHNEVIETVAFADLRSKHKMQRNISRIFSNYLSSLFAHIEFTRRIDKFYKTNSDLNKKVTERKMIFLKSKFHKTIQELRNYSIHFENLKIGSEIRYVGSNEVTKSILLYKKDLLKFKFGANAKKLIQEMPEKIRLNEILDEYHYTFVEFQRFLFMKILVVDEIKTEKFICDISFHYEELVKLNIHGTNYFNVAFLRLIKYSFNKAKNDGK